MNSVISAGLQGMQQSQHTMQKYAQDIASVNKDNRQAGVKGSESPPPSQPPLDANRGNGLDSLPVNEVPASQQAKSANSDPNAPVSIEESIVSMRQQEQIFNASAATVKVGEDAVGSLIDDYS